MDDINEHGTELYSHHGVLLKSQSACRDEDTQCSGTLSIVEYSFGKCIEWKPTEVSVDSETHDQEWAMVNAVGRRTRTSSGSTEGHSRCRSVHIEIADLKSFRITRNGQQVTMMQRDGTTHSAFFFQHGNADCFVSNLKGYIRTSRSRKDKHLYVVLDQPESQVLDRSFAELDLFTENTSDVVWKFVRNLHSRPYETTLEAFSKLTDIWLYKPLEQRREEEVAELLNKSLTLDETSTNVVGEEYAVIQLGNGPVLPPRPMAPRGSPLTVDQWAQYQDEEGRVTDVDTIKDIIFRGGVVPQLRYEVWKYLLGYFPWDSTHAERQQLRKKKIEEYFQMKLQWRTITPGQEQRFSDYRERKSLIVALPELASYLEQHDSGNMFFCFRWLLVLFKREFSFQDIMRLWEVLWTDLPCPNFHLLLCVAILDTEQTILIENNYGFTEILKHINDLSLHIELDLTLCKAEGIYHQLTSAVRLPDIVRRIIGLEPLGDAEDEEQNSASSQGMDLSAGENGLKVDDGPESLETVTFAAATGEVAFERSLNLNYL
ncbi:hypothetical protein C0J52_04140 [Blattella germanica]|nr:hypothetical protein C0J52_04140 [Blattella germanica]